MGYCESLAYSCGVPQSWYMGCSSPPPILPTEDYSR